MALLDRLQNDFNLPPPVGLVIDEKTHSYIEKLKNDVTKEFVGPLNVKLDDFEGPLDLLLYLVKQARVNIADIFLSNITDQYLKILQNVEELDLIKASDFISIAAILLEVKSKSLLPVSEFELPEAENSGRVLIQKLEEYKLLKEAAEKLKPFETTGLFFKEPEPSATEAIEVLKDMNRDALFKAVQKLFLRLEKRPLIPTERHIVRDRFTVAEKMGHVREILKLRERVSFFELFDSDYSKLEIITTFQSLLELLKLQEVIATQHEDFGDIVISQFIGNTLHL